MKKDMGGAALMLAVAHVVMAFDLPVRLSIRLGCVENSISGCAFRPGDVLTSRKGTTIEIGNTDAEGRLVLADLLNEACDENPTWLIDAATLTGAARVALGPEVPALFCNDDALASSLLNAGIASNDQFWRLPLWPAYEPWLKSKIADVNNVAESGMAGAITAALFLEKFVTRDIRWAHIDTYAWNDTVRDGHPIGGDLPGLRAIFRAILDLVNK